MQTFEAQQKTALTVVLTSDNPISQGFIAWGFDPLLAVGTSVPAQGVMPLTRMVVQATATSTCLGVVLTVAAVTPVSGQCGAYLFDSAGNLLASTTSAEVEGKITAASTGGSVTKFNWQTPVALTAGQIVFAGFYTNAATNPSVARSGANAAALVRPNGTTLKRYAQFGPYTNTPPAPPLNYATAADPGALYWLTLGF